MDKKALAPKVIALLQNIKARPHCYLSQQPGAIGGFLVGFYTMAKLVGFKDDAALSEKLIHQTGAISEAQMREEGYDEEAIIQEMLSHEILYWKAILADEEEDNES